MTTRRVGRYALASLYSGAGGLDFGFADEGFSFKFAADIDEAACRTFARNLGLQPRAADLRNLDAAQVRGCDILLAGPPCQGFSSFRRRGGSDPRNGLFIRTANLIAAVRPKIFVVENVRGILNHASGRFATWAMRILQEAGLVVEPFVVECVHFGVPQRRRRVVLIGGNARYGRRAISEFHAIWHKGKARSLSTVGKALDGLERTAGGVSNHVVRSDSPDWYHDVIACIGPGQKLCDTRRGASSVHSWQIPHVFGRVTVTERTMLEALSRIRRHSVGRRYRHLGDGQAVTVRQLAHESGLTLGRLTRALCALDEKGYISRDGRYIDLTRKFNGRFKRLNSEQPAPAVTADFGSPRTVLHPTEDRGLTVRECARLQGFPDSFVFEGSITTQYRLVANAVPPPVSIALAAAVKAALSR